MFIKKFVILAMILFPAHGFAGNSSYCADISKWKSYAQYYPSVSPSNLQTSLNYTCFDKSNTENPVLYRCSINCSGIPTNFGYGPPNFTYSGSINVMTIYNIPASASDPNKYYSQCANCRTSSFLQKELQIPAKSCKKVKMSSRLYNLDKTEQQQQICADLILYSQ